MGSSSHLPTSPTDPNVVLHAARNPRGQSALGDASDDPSLSYRCSIYHGSFYTYHLPIIVPTVTLALCHTICCHRRISRRPRFCIVYSVRQYFTVDKPPTASMIFVFHHSSEDDARICRRYLEYVIDVDCQCVSNTSMYTRDSP